MWSVLGASTQWILTNFPPTKKNDNISQKNMIFCLVSIYCSFRFPRMIKLILFVMLLALFPGHGQVFHHLFCPYSDTGLIYYLYVMLGTPRPPKLVFICLGRGGGAGADVLRIFHSFYQYILWQETSGLQKKNTDGSSESSPRSMEDILEENAALKYQNQWLIGVITKNISDLSDRVQNNSEEVSSVR